MTCHFSISDVRFAFWAFFSKTGKTRVWHRVKMMTRWPGRERWPGDPVTQWPSSMSGLHRDKAELNVAWVHAWVEWIGLGWMGWLWMGLGGLKFATQCSRVRILRFFRFQKNVTFYVFLKWRQKVIKRRYQKFTPQSFEMSSHTSLSDHCNSISVKLIYLSV